jgi:hypothetical protein
VVALSILDHLARAVLMRAQKLLLGYVLMRPYNQRANAQKIEQQVAIPGMVALVILGLVASLAIFKMLR